MFSNSISSAVKFTRVSYPTNRPDVFCNRFFQKSLLALICALPAAASARDYFVSPNGNNSAAGTATAPFRTIQKAVNEATPGSTVFLGAGVYRERVEFPRSGKDGRFITVRNIPGQNAVVDAQGVSGKHIFYLWNRSYIRIQGLEIRNNLKVNDGSMIRVEGHGRYIQIIDNVMHHTSGKDAMGITFYGSHSSIALSNLLVRGNTLYEINPGWSETVTLNGNVNNFLVENNVIRDVNNIGIDFIGGEGTCPNARYDKARKGVCRGNKVTRANSSYEDGYAAGIYVDGGVNIVIEDNEVTECDLGIEVGAENPKTVVSRVTVRNNLIYNNDKPGLIFGGYARSRGRVINCEFSRNTLYKNDTKKTWGGEIYIQWASGNRLKNNVVVAGNNNVFLYSEEGNVNNTLDDNIYWSDGGASRAEFTWKNKFAGTYSKYQAISDQDRNSKFSNPLLRDPARGDFRMRASTTAGALLN